MARERDADAELRKALDQLQTALAGGERVQSVSAAAIWQGTRNGFAALMVDTIARPPEARP